MTDLGHTTLETERLLLRPLEERDIEDIIYYAGDDESYRWTIAIPHPYTEQDALDFMKISSKTMADGKGLSLGMELKETGRLIGGAGFARLDLKNKSCEIGYVVGPDHRGQGFAPEASRELLRFAFEDLGLERVHVKHFDGNDSSKRVIEKLGFRFEGTARHEVYKDGEYIDTHNYSLLRGEWKA